MPPISVRVVDLEGLQLWHEGSRDIDPVLGIPKPRPAWAKQKIEQTGETVLCWENPPGSFSWICPGCGGLNLGQLGDEPTGGWEEPRWVNSGTREQPTLAPSLGCPGWRNGFCSGHYWLRDGELVPA